MTLSELAEELNLSEATLIYSFPRTKKNFAKRGIILTKKGRGETAEYFLDYEEQNVKEIKVSYGQSGESAAVFENKDSGTLWGEFEINSPD